MRGSPTALPEGSRCGCTRAPAAMTLHAGGGGGGTA
jgi:hypothetical protein